MPTILHAIHNASIEDIETDSGIWFRVRKICSADLARVGFAVLAMSTPEDATADAEPEAEADPMDMLKNISPRQAQEIASLQDATVCAGVMAAGDGQGNWEDLEVVLDQKRENPDGGTLWVGSLPAGSTEQIFSAVMSLSTDRGASAERLASFRGSAGSPARPMDGVNENGQIPTRDPGVGSGADGASDAVLPASGRDQRTDDPKAEQLG